MLTSANVVFLSCDPQEFKNKSGETIHFQKVTFIVAGEKKPMTLTALNDLDFSKLEQFCNLKFGIDFYTDDRSGYLKGKIVSVS